MTCQNRYKKPQYQISLFLNTLFMLNTLNQALWELQNRRLKAYFKVMDSLEDQLEPFAKG